MKGLCGLGSCERILLLTVGLCLLVLIAVGSKLLHVEQVGQIQLERIRVSQSKIKAYELDIAGLQNKVIKLQAENCQLEQLKKQVYVRTLVQIDSVRALPFNGKSGFFAEQTARLDTIRARHVNRNF